MYVFWAENVVSGVPMGNITEAKVVQYDANMCHYDAKFVHYDANIVQGDAIFVPNETTDFADYADFGIDFCHPGSESGAGSGHRVPQRVRKKLATEDAEDTDSGLVYLIFNFGYYSMG
jgi:hypothetical protein